ncbi:outer membrane protein assembly factor BamC [Pseudohongiella sp.]|uniref:Outer membrane protein assembly factor BamC n=2 Tax=root TaxID=1 RepID=A0A0F9WGR4_9ZZZZ|nr:outer membrane protein assembly factor BamC [Pseudohongiella sp.]HDZ09107.1 outer membrane protein assembly factor BamC [Pseudohongiella sp.]HEA63557.1 outer membrane protein assembly factor BamC [Pseudohongiella sp.]
MLSVSTQVDKFKMLRTLTVLVVATSVSACSWLGIGGEEGWLRDRQDEYLRAEITPPMQIPSELDSYTIDELYYIPEEAPGDRALYIVPPAPKPIDSRVREGVVVQRFGERAWIVIGATSGQVWPRLRDYWSTEEVALSSENAEAGLLETVWLPQSDTNLRHKYQVRVEPGLHAGNSEIYVRHVSDNGGSAANEPAQFPEESDSQERENTILASISLYLADRTDIYRASSVSMLAGSIEALGKARVVTAGAGDTRLELRLDLERAWSQLNQAINNANIEVLNADRDAQRFQVAFSGAEEEEEPGFFGRLFGGGDDAEVINFDITVAETEQGISVRAVPSSGQSAPYEQDLLIRTINDNLI